MKRELSFKPQTNHNQGTDKQKGMPRQNKTRQDKPRYDKTRYDKTRYDKTK